MHLEIHSYGGNPLERWGPTDSRPWRAALAITLTIATKHGLRLAGGWGGAVAFGGQDSHTSKTLRLKLKVVQDTVLFFLLFS